MFNYELILIENFYNIMADCESSCALFHMEKCCYIRIGCFYEKMLNSAFTALEMGWY